MRSNTSRKAVLMLLLATTPFAQSFAAFTQALKSVVPVFEVKKQSLTTAVNALEKKTGVRFSYDQRALEGFTVQHAAWKNEPVSTILDGLLQKTGLQYEERQNTIIIFPVSPETSNVAAAPGHEVTGRVLDDNGPVAGATIKIKNTNKGTTSDITGSFRVEVGGEKAVLVISMIGYQTREVEVTGDAPISVRLQVKGEDLNQLVVVGYTSQQRSKLTGAISEVKMDQLSSRSVGSVEEAMQGKVAGVTVTSEGGDPTSTPHVYIHGLGGINGQSPLYIVDGSVYYAESVPTINPNEIESMTVLKDASAAIYGARAGGGVILITTKKGKAGNAVINLDAKYGYQDAWKKLKTLNAKQFADVENLAADNAGKQRSPAFDINQNPDAYTTRTNWMDEIFRTGKIQDYNGSISGGNEKSKYFMGFGYRKTDAILLNTYGQRYNFRLNSDHQLKPWLKFGETMSYSSTDGNGAETQSDYTGAIIAAIFYPPSIRPYQPDGSFSGLPLAFAGNYGDEINPVAYLRRLDLRQPSNKLFVNPYLDVHFLKNFTFRSNLAVTKINGTFKQFTPRVPEIGKIFLGNTLVQAQNNTSDLLAEQTLTYEKHLGKHYINAVGGYSWDSWKQEYFQVTASTFDDERYEYRYLQNGALVLTDPGATYGSLKQTAIESFFARANYDYDGRFLVNALARRDGSSRVGAAQRFETYYAGSIGWQMKKEAFLRDVEWLSNLKPRASYGTLGDLGSLPENALDIPLSRTVTYMGPDATPVYGYAVDAVSNPRIRWAKSKQFDAGLDLGFFANRLTFSGDWYHKNTDRMLYQQPATSADGVSTGPWVNGGNTVDKGFDLALGFNGNPKGDFQYSVTATASKIMNRLEGLPGGVTTQPIGENIRSTLNPLLNQVGSPLYSYYLVKTAGIFQSQKEIDSYVGKDGTPIQPNAKPGDLKFVDFNGDGKINNNDRQVLGSALPKFSYGLSFNASYKGFDLNLFVQGVKGNRLFNAVKFTGLNASTGQGYNMLADILNAWSPEHTNTNIPRISASDANGNFNTNSDWYLEDGSYLRMKNVTLGYTLPARLTTRAGLNLVRLYVTSNNLFTITKYTGMDPEVGMDHYGIDAGRYPQSRTFLLGLNVNF